MQFKMLFKGGFCSLDFYILILYLATLMNSFFSSNSLSGDSLGYLQGLRISTNAICKTELSAKRDNFMHSFPIWEPLISSSWLTVLPRPS